MKSLDQSLCNIGNVFRKERKAQNLSIEDLAGKSNISFQTIVGIENGKTNFKIKTFIALVDALALSADNVMGIAIEHPALKSKCSHLTDGQQNFLNTMINALEDYDNNREVVK